MPAVRERRPRRRHVSVNAWAVRVLAAALARDEREREPRQRGGRVGQTYAGWVRSRA